MWSSNQEQSIKRVHLNFCKRILRVKRTTQNDFAYGELGRYPVFVGVKITIIIRRTQRRDYLDNAFMPHCTIFPHMRAQWAAVMHRWTRPQHQMHFRATFLIMVIETRFNFQICVQCAEKAIAKITVNFPMKACANLAFEAHLSIKGRHQRVREQWGLSGLISAIRPDLAAWPGGVVWCGGVGGGGGGGGLRGHPPQLKRVGSGWFE